MISIRQNYFCVKIIYKIARRKPLDRALCSDGHKDGGFDGAMGRVEKAGTGSGVGAGSLNFET